MYEISCTPDQLVAALLEISRSEPVSLLDSCGDSYLDSHTLIAGIEPDRTVSITGGEPASVLTALEQETAHGNAVFFTLSYEFGRRLAGLDSSMEAPSLEPDCYASVHKTVVTHDYRSGATQVTGDSDHASRLLKRIAAAMPGKRHPGNPERPVIIRSNFTKPQYLDAVETIRERIRRGDTYQTNLTHQLSFDLGGGDWTPQDAFMRLRVESPAAFAAFLTRPGSTVISGSPERFFKLMGDHVSASPIKGTRARSEDLAEDERNKMELLQSNKDAAENIMIVDLVRNDLGRLCEYGSVTLQKLCGLETHRTLYHLVSTLNGELRRNTSLSDILGALFPCGSITGAPKISTMRIIDELEPHARGLSMGAIGYALPPGFLGPERVIDANVAIRTAVIRDGLGEFSIGGGIVIDSVGEQEFAETLTKAEAIRSAIGGRIVF